MAKIDGPKKHYNELFNSTEVGNYNIYNGEMIDKFCATISRRTRNKHIKLWLKTILRNWLRRQGRYMKMVVTSQQLAHPLVQFYRAEMVSRVTDGHDHYFDWEESRFHIRNVDSLPEDWAREALERGELYYFEPTHGPQMVDTIIHWIDFLSREGSQLAKREIRYSVPELIGQVEEWDKQLARQKQIDDLRSGTLEVYRAPDNSFYVDMLITRKAYRAEGAIMSHCVRDYFERDCIIYSFRSPDRAVPHMTLEVRTRKTPLLKAKSQKPGPKGPVPKVVSAAHRTLTEAVREAIGDPDFCYDWYDRIIQVQRRSKARLETEHYEWLKLWATELFGNADNVEEFRLGKSRVGYDDDDDYDDEEDDDDMDDDEEEEEDEEEEDVDEDDVPFRRTPPRRERPPVVEDDDEEDEDCDCETCHGCDDCDCHYPDDEDEEDDEDMDDDEDDEIDCECECSELGRDRDPRCDCECHY